MLFYGSDILFLVGLRTFQHHLIVIAYIQGKYHINSIFVNSMSKKNFDDNRK